MLDRFFPLYALVFLLTLTVTVVIEKRIIPYLKARAAQPIYEGGPAWHMSKSGTPTMGGVAFFAAITLSLLIASLFLFMKNERDGAVSLLIALLFSSLNTIVGIIDDLKKLKKKENAGLSPGQKLLFQLAFAIIFLYLRAKLLNDGTTLSFSFGNIDLGFFYYPLSLVMILGTVNCANLTDGIDGLAGSVAFSISTVIFFVSASLFYDCALISSAVMGGAIGFLCFNLHPAKIFMGDTGSLFFGAILVSTAFSFGNPLLFVFFGGVYVIEGISVIIQVISFKLTGNRVFKMSPIHHHFERCGLSENTICIIAIITTFILSVPAFIFFLP